MGFIHQNESWCEFSFCFVGSFLGFCLFVFSPTFYRCPMLLAYFYQGYAFCGVLGLGSGGGGLGVWRGGGYRGMGTTKSITPDHHILIVN